MTDEPGILVQLQVSVIYLIDRGRPGGGIYWGSLLLKKGWEKEEDEIKSWWSFINDFILAFFNFDLGP